MGLLCGIWRWVSVQGTMKSPDCSGTELEQNVLSSVRKLGLSYRSGLLQQDNGPKLPENDTQEWLRAEPFTTSLSTGLNPFEHMWKELKPAAWRNSLQTLFSCRGLGLKCLSWCRGQKSLLSVLHYFTDWNGFFRAKAFCLCWELEKLSRTTKGPLNKVVLLSWTQGVHSDGWRVK